MTLGQERALRELKQLCAIAPDDIELAGTPQETNNCVSVTVSLRLGLMETRPKGLEFYERENFVFIIPPDFPFDYPTIKVNHDRFAGFPHVIWSRTLCLYQSKLEWNPSDGLLGFFERLKLWLGRAAMNDMDPIDGPLEPPHHITDFSQVPFVIRADAPVQAGEKWIGLAVLDKQANRIELVGWNETGENWPSGKHPALTIILPKPLPMEFPQRGADLFKELEKQELGRDLLIKYLALASLFSSEDEPMHFVVGLPMRRSVDGGLRIHIAIWTTTPEFTKSLRNTIPKEADSEELKSIRKELADALHDLFEVTSIKWCKVLEDRNEIVVRRESKSAVGWFANKKILILGCGALGSWAAEIVARSNAASIHVLDHSIVKPGLLSRQNYLLEDIGCNKAEALARRLQSIAPEKISINHFKREAHAFITEDPNRFNEYDVVIDCTASHIFQMKLERDWGIFERRTPRIISMIINAHANCCLAVVLNKNSFGGIWDAYIRLKCKISFDESCKKFSKAFYSPDIMKNLFQPEPGCSDPTFIGSMADVASLVSTALNLSVARLDNMQASVGFAFSNHTVINGGTLKSFSIPNAEEIPAGNYRVRISRNMYREARGWIRQNERLRSRDNETGGLIWGLWDDATGVIWVFDISGPPKDSLHDLGHFVCGTDGTIEEHDCRFKRSNGVCGFIGFWHTHPDMSSMQSIIDIGGMSGLVSRLGQNKKRSLMIIFGNRRRQSTAGVYVYESQSGTATSDIVLVSQAQVTLAEGIL
jgi:hypothetical protein